MGKVSSADFAPHRYHLDPQLQRKVFAVGVGGRCAPFSPHHPRILSTSSRPQDAREVWGNMFGGLTVRLSLTALRCGAAANPRITSDGKAQPVRTSGGVAEKNPEGHI